MDYIVRPFDPAMDIPARVELYNGIFPEFPTTIDQQLDWERVRPPDRVALRLVAEYDQRTVGFSVAADKQLPNSKEFSLSCWVAHDARGQGIGANLVRRSLAFAREHGAVRVLAYVRDDDPDSMRFAQVQGFSKLHHSFEVALSLEDFDAARLNELDGFHSDSGVILTDLKTWGDTLEHRHAMHALMIETLGDVPDEPMRDGFEVFSSWLEKKFFDPAGVQLALDLQGQAVGFSWLMLDTSTGQIENWGTGIRREFRRQGLAWVLKLAGIRWARDHGGKRITTVNHQANLGMRTINQRLGFERQLGMWEMELRLEGPLQQEAV
jgi:mycothiol synthase